MPVRRPDVSLPITIATGLRSGVRDIGAMRTSFTERGTEDETGLVRGTFPGNEDIFPVIWRGGGVV
jgi:hypothetical protein